MTPNEEILQQALERLSKLFPKTSETHAYQAEGYAFGWNQAIAVFHREAKAIVREAKVKCQTASGN